jgi:RND superfamily putative drug exporter
VDLPRRLSGRVRPTAAGTVVANVPVLLFCIAFGLSMDYAVFLVSRIREDWLTSGRPRADNDDSVALNVARTGRVVTAAAQADGPAARAVDIREVSAPELTAAAMNEAGLCVSIRS